METLRSGDLRGHNWKRGDWVCEIVATQTLDHESLKLGQWQEEWLSISEQTGSGGCPRHLNFWHLLLYKFGVRHGVKAHQGEIKCSSIFI